MMDTREFRPGTRLRAVSLPLAATFPRASTASVAMARAPVMWKRCRPRAPAPEKIRASIVNPARLSPKLRMDLCMQCHLEPTSTAFPALIRRFNRGPFSFTAGEPLDAFELAFDHARGTQHDDKFEIVGSSAYRLRQSRCFLESKDALTCETCHDPHRVPRAEEAARHYEAVCRQCHAAPFDALVSKGMHPASTDCVACHMPRRRTEDVVHVVMTDHLIQRRPPSGDLMAELAERHPTEAEEYRGEVVPYYPATLPPSRSGRALPGSGAGGDEEQSALRVSPNWPG